MRSCHNEIMLMGDFNLALDDQKDRYNCHTNNNKNKYFILELMAEYMLTDSWRARHENDREYSWWQRLEDGTLKKASRIDLCLITPGLMQQLHDIYFINSEQTDHRALIAVFDMKSEDRGPGYWKFNSSLLTNSTVVEQIRKEIAADIRSVSSKNPEEAWEIIKKRIKKTAMRIARKEASEKNLLISQLNEIISDLETRLPLPEKDDTLLLDSKRDLTKLLDEKTNSLIFRSKAKWYAEGDRSSKYFFNLEKSRYNNRKCLQIYNKEKKLVRDLGEILEVQRIFYQELYTLNSEVSFSLDKIESTILPRKEEDSSELKIEELDVAIKGMARNKSPGPDGITVEYFGNILDVHYMQL